VYANRSSHSVARAIFRALLVLALIGGGFVASPAQRAAAAIGGPVILGGDDMTDHGSIDSSGNPVRGWLYLERALENIKPQVVRANNNSVAALGSAATSTPSGGDAGSAIGVAAAKAGMSVTYFDGAAAINGFFSALAAGTVSPRIIWIAGNGARNDLDSAEESAVNANAVGIAGFVNSGGGLMSHGTVYGWLSALLPGLSTVNGGSSGDLSLTPAGTAAFPGLTNTDVNAGPWHNHFEGNFGGLQVLTTSARVMDSAGNPAAVIIGGAAVVLPSSIVLSPATATNPVGTSHTVTATVKNIRGAASVGTTVTFAVISGPNTGATGTGVTDAAGQTTFTYTDSGGAGVDTIRGSFVDQADVTQQDTVSKTWGAGGAAPVPTIAPRLAVITASAAVCGQIAASATGLTAGLPYKLVASPAAGGTAQTIDVTASGAGSASATFDLKGAGGTYSVYVELAIGIKYSKVVTVTAMACPTPPAIVVTPVATPVVTPATPAPGLVPSTAASPPPPAAPAPAVVGIGRLPSTSTGDSGTGPGGLLLGLLAIGAIAWRLRASRI